MQLTAIETLNQKIVFHFVKSLWKSKEMIRT